MTNKTLIQYLRQNIDGKGIPTLSRDQWKHINEIYDKETIVASLMEYIDQYKPEPPVCNIKEQDMTSCFHNLKKQSYEKFFLSYEETKDRVTEKFDDYGKPYKDYGLGVIQMGNTYIDVSNFFNQTLRMECDSYGFKAPHYRWKHPETMRSVLLALWRLGNDKLDEYSFVVAFRLASYIATQFKPHVAKTIYDAVNAKTIFDSSCGWGDRLAGFYCSNATEYYGCDPNEQVFAMYQKQVVAYERLLGCEPKMKVCDDYFTCEGAKKVTIWRSAAEDLNYSLLPGIDCAFTSPPYFSTELYNSNGVYVEDQSWKRYDTYEKWRDGFYLPVSRKTYEALNEGGIQIVNIQDPKIKTKRYYASDDLVQDLTTKYKDCSFIGNLGMRIMQRPKNMPKEKMAGHFKGIYIEPCWVFGKNRKHFIMNVSGGLEDFMT